MNYQEAQEELDAIKDRKRDRDKFTLAFCGIFSAGKTTVINHLLSYDSFLLPVGVSAVTKIVTHIEYGPELVIYYRHKGKKQMIDRQSFMGYVQGIIFLPENCNMLYIEMPSVFLRNGVIILDTPGFLDERGGRLDEMSRQAVYTADLAVFCINALSLGNMFEKEYLQELEKSLGNFYVIVNRMNNLSTQSDVDATRESTRNLVNHRGGKYLQVLEHDNIFFITAEGVHKNYEGFDKHISYVTENSSLREKIQKTSFMQIQKFRLNRLQAEIEIAVIEVQAELKSLLQKHEKQKELFYTKQKNAKMEQERVRESCWFHFTTSLDLAMDRVSVQVKRMDNGNLKQVKKPDQESDQCQNEIEFVQTLADNFNCLNIPESFVCLVDGILLRELIPVAEAWDEGMATILAGHPSDEVESRRLQDIFHECLQQFHVSVPKGTLVKKRGFLGRTIYSLSDMLSDIVCGDFDLLTVDIDDGCDLEYLNYASGAVNEIKTKLLPRLLEEAEHLLQEFEQQVKEEPVFESGLESRIQELKVESMCWNELKTSVESFSMNEWKENLL